MEHKLITVLQYLMYAIIAILSLKIVLKFIIWFLMKDSIQSKLLRAAGHSPEFELGRAVGKSAISIFIACCVLYVIN